MRAVVAGCLSLLCAAVSPRSAAAQRARPAADDRAAFEERVERALDRAQPALLRALRDRDGGELALVCLAASYDPELRGHKTFASALRRLARTDLHDTYGLALRLMVAAHVEDFPDRESTSHRDAEELLGHQAVAGGFSYSMLPTSWDLSNTQYAALGMRAAVYLGQTVPDDAWKRLAAATCQNQDDYGGFSYVGRGGPTMSMTVAGIAILELCSQQFARSGADTTDLVARVSRGWGWLAREVRQIGMLDNWHAYYAHYGLERAAVLSGKTEVGETDWYRAGAEPMLRLQKRDGTFSKASTRDGDATAIDTAFAVLFLRRAFQRELRPSGPTTPSATLLCHQLGPNADDATIARAVECDVDRGDAAVPDLLAAMRSEIGTRRRAAAHALLRISGIDFRYHPGRTDEQNAAALERAEAWWAERRRGH